MEKLFHLKENHTDVKTEVMAGITTFMTMAYILAVNPNILSAAGMDAEAVLIATSLAAFVGTMCMALMANYPFALAPGMGLNAYFAYTVVLTMGYSWQMALLAVFVEGIVFIILSLTNVREAIFNAIPMTLKSAVSVGIGLFIAFVGLQNAKLIVNSDSTLLTYQHFKGETFHSVGVGALLALIGVASKADMLDEDGKLPRIKGALLADAVATSVSNRSTKRNANMTTMKLTMLKLEKSRLNTWPKVLPREEKSKLTKAVGMTEYIPASGSGM